MCGSPSKKQDVEFLGFTLSGANSRYVSFQPCEHAEQKIREGMFIIINDIVGKESLCYYAIIHSIESHHEFLEPGEVWSEAIRKGIRPPDKVARKYLIARARILGQLSSEGLQSANRPPRPGSPVYMVSEEVLSLIYGINSLEEISKKPEYLKIGSLYGYTEEQFPALLNLENITMHIAVVGITGSGKSNTVGTIIEELGSRNVETEHLKTIPIMIIDANGDYIDYFEKPELVPNFDKIYRLVFVNSKAYSNKHYYTSPEVPGSKRRRIMKPIGIDLNLFEPYELAELIIRFYHAGKLEGAELQLQLLQKVLEHREVKGKDINELFLIQSNFEYLCEDIINSLKDNYHHTTIAAVQRALRNFREELVNRAKVITESREEASIDEDFIDEITDPQTPALVIVDFSTEGATAVSMFAKQFIVYYLLLLLFKKFVKYKIENSNRVMILGIEEAQNFAPNLSLYPLGMNIARNMLATVATQGRKFGLSLLLITQRPSYVDPVVMSMMNTFIIHRVSPADVNYVNNVSGGLPKFIRDKLTIMEKGLAVVSGQMNPFPIPVLVKIRKRELHKAGTVSIFRRIESS